MKIQPRAIAHYFWKEWIKPLAIIAAIVFPLKSAVADWNWVPSGSMRPTIREGEFVFINKLAYDLKFPFTTLHLAEWSNPKRGDIVVFFSPHDGTRLVKRVIGLPGDKISLHDNRLQINGQPLSYEPADNTWQAYSPASEKTNAVVFTEHLDPVSHLQMSQPSFAALRNFDEITVPEGRYFMMGDNRDVSFDSRYFGFVARDQIVGQAKAIVISFDPDRHLLPRMGRWLTGLN